MIVCNEYKQLLDDLDEELFIFSVIEVKHAN